MQWIDEILLNINVDMGIMMSEVAASVAYIAAGAHLCPDLKEVAANNLKAALRAMNDARAIARSNAGATRLRPRLSRSLDTEILGILEEASKDTVVALVMYRGFLRSHIDIAKLTAARDLVARSEAIARLNAETPRWRLRRRRELHRRLGVTLKQARSALWFANLAGSAA